MAQLDDAKVAGPFQPLWLLGQLVDRTVGPAQNSENELPSWTYGLQEVCSSKDVVMGISV